MTGREQCCDHSIISPLTFLKMVLHGSFLYSRVPAPALQVWYYPFCGLTAMRTSSEAGVKAFQSTSSIVFVDSGFSISVIALKIAEMFMLFEVLGGYGWVRGRLGDGESVGSQLGHSYIQKRFHRYIRNMENSRVGWGLPLPGVISLPLYDLFELCYPVQGSMRSCLWVISTPRIWEMMLHADSFLMCHSVLTFFFFFHYFSSCFRHNSAYCLTSC